VTTRSERHRLRAAVIGCGAIGHQHLGYLSDSGIARLVGVCDRSRALVDYARSRYGAEAAYLDSADMLASAKPEIVHVLTPPQTHPALVRQVIEAGAHVICEKPLAPSLAETEPLLALAERAALELVESRNLLFNDVVLQIDRLLATDRLGRVREIDILLSLDLAGGAFGDLNLSGPGVALPGGAVHDFLPHLVYLYLHFAGGARVTTVDGRLENLSGNERVGFDSLDALLQGGGVRGRLRIASDLKPDAFRLSVRGDEGGVETDFYNPYLRIEGGKYVGKRAPLEQLSSGIRMARAGVRNFRDKVVQHGTYHGLPRMIEAVYQAILDGRPAPIRPAQIRAAAELVDKVLNLARPR
jgi:predicted dehydrogenase